MAKSCLSTPLCDVLGVRYPILQAGMGGNAVRGLVAGPELAAAVSNAGGLGVLGAATLSVDEFRQALRTLHGLTKNPFGVNLTFPGGDTADVAAGVGAEIPAEYQQFARGILERVGVSEARQKPAHSYNNVTREVSLKKLEIVLDERVPVLVYSLGDPGRETIDVAHRSGMKVIALAGTTRQAVRLKNEGVDAVVAIGYEAGGHSGYVGTVALVPSVVDAVKPLPVVAGGGIVDGRGIVAALVLGASGVWMGTRFLTSFECSTQQWIKELALEATDTSTTKSKFITGKPNRHLRSPWDDAWEEAGKKPLPIPLQGFVYWDYYTSVVQAKAFKVSGETVGQGAGLIKELKPAAQIVRDLVAEAEAVAASFA